jgi:two-component system response regulator NreC
MTEGIRVLLADDHAVLCAGLRLLLEREADMTVVGEAADAVEVVDLASRVTPHVVLMDVSMPRGGGVEATRKILQIAPETRVLILTMHEEEAYLKEALRAGARGYLVKRAADTELVTAIRAVASGELYIDPLLAGAVVSRAMEGALQKPHVRARASHVVSTREEEILRLIAAGHTGKEVAVRLCISVKTVETHKARAMAKLGLRGRAALVRYALESGWLEDIPRGPSSPAETSPEES